MSRIDDARAADLDRRLSLATWRDEIQMGEVERLLADRADYKARIEELERELAKAEALSDLAGANGAKFALIASAGGMSDKEIEERLAPGRKAALEVLKELRTQLPTPSPTDAPASDTRGLAVEIDAEMVEHAKRSVDSFYLPGDSEERRYIRDILKAAAPLILRKALPPSPDTDRKLADLRAEFDQLTGVLEDRRSELEAADRKLARAVALEERLQAIIDWADLALSNRAEFDKHGVKNLAGPVFDAARDVLADLTTAPAEAEKAPDIKPIVEALQGLFDITEDSEGVTGYHKNGEVALWGEFPEVEAAKTVLEAINKSKGE